MAERDAGMLQIAINISGFEWLAFWNIPWKVSGCEVSYSDERNREKVKESSWEDERK